MMEKLLTVSMSENSLQEEIEGIAEELLAYYRRNRAPSEVRDLLDRLEYWIIINK
jgi:hypothetical protein